MSLLPLILNDDWNALRPSRLLDQHFGMGLDLDDLLAPITSHLPRCLAEYYQPWHATTSRNTLGMTADKDKFQVNLDVQHFKPSEITVSVNGDNTITVEGKHEEKQDEHGFISRHFMRKYVLPEGHDIKNVVSSLSLDGVLTITAPHVNQEGVEECTIPIQQTGAPLKPIKNIK